MTIQTIIYNQYAPAREGNIADNGPKSIRTYIMGENAGKSTEIGLAYTTTDSETINAGGVGRFAGIATIPEAQALRLGLSPTLVVPSGSPVGCLELGTIWVRVKSATTVGQNVEFEQATGEMQGVTGDTPTANFTIIPQAVFLDTANPNSIARIRVGIGGV